jgi:2-polyprenyl-6-methoxyphenol hydroxylase-like FAD-dependent oxidoreductase
MVGGETVRASYVVGADGMHSAVRDETGIGFPGEPYGQSFGMNTAMQDAVALAARLAAVLRDGAGERSLDGYQAERRPVAAGVVALPDRMTRVATVHRPRARRLRNAAPRLLDRFPAVDRKIALNLSELAVDGRRP